MIYNLNKDAVINKPNLYCEHGLKPLYSLEESKETLDLIQQLIKYN